MKLTTASGFLGIDERADFKNNLGAATAMRNFRVTDSQSIVKRQGFDWVYQLPTDIDGIWCGNIAGKNMVIVIAGGRLYRCEPNTVPATPIMIGAMGAGECMMFEFGGVLYIKSDKRYCKYNGVSLKEVEGYVPLVAMSCTPYGEGEVFEQINLLSNKRRQLFSGNGSALLYFLAEQNIDGVESVLIDGAVTDIPYGIDKTRGTVSFKNPPPEGLNNVEITYYKAHSESDIKRIMGCKKMMLFGGNSDGRVFMWGNSDYPNYRFHSDLADGVPSAEYFPVNAFSIIGNSKINSIVQQYDRQLIFTDNEAYYSYCEMRDDGMGNTYSSFPVFSLNNGKGCIFETNGCVIDNKPVTLCLDGLNMWESTSVQNEKNAVCFSAPVWKSLKNAIGGDTSKMSLFDFQANRELYFIYGDEAFIYNYGNGTWYMYDGFEGKHYSVYGKLLYFARGDILFAFGNDLECSTDAVCVWEGAYIHAGSGRGRCDFVRFDADMHISGSDNIRFEFKKSGADYTAARELSFGEGTDRHLRLSIRPAMKRAMPFKVIFADNGPGKCELFGMTVTTREKERSSRDGIL